MIVTGQSFTGTGKTLLARAVASQLDCNFLKVSLNSLVDLHYYNNLLILKLNYELDNMLQSCSGDPLLNMLKQWLKSRSLTKTITEWRDTLLWQSPLHALQMSLS